MAENKEKSKENKEKSKENKDEPSPLKVDQQRKKEKDVPPHEFRPFLQEEFISMFYKPHTASVLVLTICSITYFAFLRQSFTTEQNIKRGKSFHD